MPVQLMRMVEPLLLMRSDLRLTDAPLLMRAHLRQTR